MNVDLGLLTWTRLCGLIRQWCTILPRRSAAASGTTTTTIRWNARPSAAASDTFTGRPRAATLARGSCSLSGGGCLLLQRGFD